MSAPASTFPSVNATSVTCLMPGRRRIAVGIVAGIPTLPAALGSRTTRFPANDELMSLLIDAFSPAAKIETKLTRATPIMSAAAVTAVRPGWRTVLSPASRPVIPRHASGRASARATSTTSAENPALIRARTCGTRIDTPIATTMRIVAIPAPEPAASTTRSRSSASTTTSTVRRLRTERGLRSSGTPSRIAAIGVTRDARRAGGRPARTVTAVPAKSETQTVRNSSTVPLSGRLAPKALNS